ncbi:hypothetical protein [Lysinibacillus fusiformis]|uniref:hypothetical protein n=1 Tax=Lysinibacillus fusiformis TaxID=28031 RepID=UPI002E24799F|nr:hypothetical protein [Lysinibacillus fusiformis]
MVTIEKWIRNIAKDICHFIDWIMHIYSNVKKRDVSVVITFISTVLITLISYFLISQITVPAGLIKILSSVKTYFNLNHINDSIIKSMIFTIISSLTIIISLLSAIYVFTSREQKSVSPSASTDKSKNKLLINVIKLMIFSVIFGSLVNGTYSSYLSGSIDAIQSLDITKKLLLRVIFLFVMLFILIYRIIVFVKYLFRTMSLDSMLVDSVELSYKLCDSLIKITKLNSFRYLLIKRYREFHFSLESVFQNLKFVADNNMNKEFEENINEFKKVFKKFKEPYKEGSTNHVSTELLKNEDQEFIKIYQSAIRSNLSLIGSLFKNQQYNKASKAVGLYFSMYIDTDEILTTIFRISLNDFLDIVDTKEEKQIRIFLDGLKILPEGQRLGPYRNLLMKLVSNNQLINITNVVYDLNVEEVRNKRSLLTILMHTLVKSIEISNYQITGFLVKYLITNNPGSEINKGLIILQKNRKRNKSLFEKIINEDTKVDYEMKGITENIAYSSNINKETYDYCIKKAYVLLYGQHVYSIEEKLWFTKKWDEKGNEIELNKEFENDEYGAYIVDKIIGASSKYGLNFFKDKKVVKSIYKELKILYPENEDTKEKEISLPKIVEQLIIKVFNINEVK